MNAAPHFDPVDIPATPDFYQYDVTPLAHAVVTNGQVICTWPDGVTLQCHPFWLLENAVRTGAVDPATREGTIDPAGLPDTAPIPEVRVVNGCLECSWPQSGITDRYHPGWLRHIAEGLHQTTSYMPPPVEWDAKTLPEPPTHDGRQVLASNEALAAWLRDLTTFGIARLRDVPTTEHAVGDIARRIGALRDTNFGEIWWVKADVNPNSTANTGLRLPPHTDLPTRETPPGFQLLHCLENTCVGGTSRMTDGLRLTNHLRDNEPHVYETLTTFRWIFFNRSPQHDHRWTGPMVDLGAPGQPLTLRAFHPVRAFPAPNSADVEAGYNAARRFSQLAADPLFQIGYPFEPGHLVAFDNRRVLHARDAFEPTAGSRRLRGCYIDHDEVFSRLRVLSRHAAATTHDLRN